jgi:hypothetical protein
MDVRNFLSDDGQCVLALCSNFALAEDGPAALTLSEWNELEGQIEKSPLTGAAELQGLGAEQIAAELGMVPGEAERISALLERAGRLAMELEGGFSPPPLRWSFTCPRRWTPRNCFSDAALSIPDSRSSLPFVRRSPGCHWRVFRDDTCLADFISPHQHATHRPIQPVFGISTKADRYYLEFMM